MSSTAAIEMKMQIDPSIQSMPELARAIEEAIAFFEGQYRDLPEDPRWSNAFMHWMISPNDQKAIQVVFSESHSERGGYASKVEIPTRYFFDEYSRTSSMRRLMFKVTGQRSAVLQQEIGRLIHEMEEEDAHR